MSEPLPEYVASGSGDQTLVFLHGLGGDHSNWYPQVDAFAADYRCVRWTLPGFGNSPKLASLTWPNLADAVVRMLDDVGVERATVVGLSMGGYIAQQVAADHGDRIERLVLAATTAQFGRGSAAFADKFLAARLAPLDEGKTPKDLAATVVPSLLGADAPSEAFDNTIASMSRISSQAYREALRCLVTWDFTDRLDEITAPTLCLAGEDDRTAPVAALQALANGLPNAQVEVIERCNHLMNLDRPDTFNRILRAFLEGR